MIHDVRAELPRADWEIGRFANKSSITVHWNGPRVDYAVDPMELILGDAHHQMSPDWPGRHGGADGIMYHRLYAPNGDVFITRDPDAVLWHCADPWGNQSSWAWQVMTGLDEDPTPAQLASLSRDLREATVDVHPHCFWTNTQCPGEKIAAWVTSDAWRHITQEEDVDPEKFRAMFLVVYAEIGVAKLFDDLKVIEAGFAEQLRKIAAGETVDALAIKELADRVAALNVQR